MRFIKPKMKVKIIRFKKGFKSVLGKLYINDEFFCFTLEREWLDNKKNVSCIPAGNYDCKPYSSIKYSSVTQITDVENRTKILIHAGNYYSDIEGCILLGDRFDESETMINGAKNRLAVWNSKKTLKKFFDKVGREFELEIIDNINLKKKKMIPLAITGAISLVKLFAPSIINKFKKAGKNLAESTAKELIKKAEKKLGFKITDNESANKAKDQLDSKDLFELEKLALKTDAKMFSDELKYGEDLGETWKDDAVTYFVIVFITIFAIAGFISLEKTKGVVEILTALLATYFGLVFVITTITAVGGRRLLNKLVDKFFR